MTQRQYARSIVTQIAVAAPTITATVLYGPLVGLAVFGICLIVGGIVAFARDIRRDINEIDERCSRIDQELDQEQAARDALRVQRTVHAEPQAPVIDFFSGDRIA